MSALEPLAEEAEFGLDHGFVVSASSSTGAAFSIVPIAEGVHMWSDCEQNMATVPKCLLGGVLLRTPRTAMSPGSQVAVTPASSDCRLYVLAEAGHYGKDGGLIRALSAHPSWLCEGGDGPTASGRDGFHLAMFSALVARDSTIMLPRVAEPDACVLLVAVPVVTGSFAVSMASNTCPTSGDQMAVVEEGVTAWRDRDHRFLGVPSCLMGGVLFQGPFKEVADGTVLRVRPNARSRVYAIVERSISGGLTEALPAAGWMKEHEAPRWHDTPTMALFGLPCPAGREVALPATQGRQAVVSVVVVPQAGAAVAPVEVSHYCPGHTASPATAMSDMPPLADGAPWGAWGEGEWGVTAATGGSGCCLTNVPPWMAGSTYYSSAGLFGAPGPPAGTRFSVRVAPPSVVYVILEAKAGGGLLPDALPGAGWERRDQAPSAGPARDLVVYARRVPAKQSLELPALREPGVVLGIAVKVDVEAFDAIAETSGGLDLAATDLQETALAWCDRLFRYTWVPTPMLGGVLFRGSHCWTPPGTTVRVSANKACRVYVLVEAEYKGGKARDGGLMASLPRTGWRVEVGAPSWNDTSSVMRTFSIRAAEGQAVTLPATKGEAVFSVVAVNIASSPDRLAAETKASFHAWDPSGLGGIRRDDLAFVLAALCPGLDEKGRAVLLSTVDGASGGTPNDVVAYGPFLDALLAAAPAGS